MYTGTQAHDRSCLAGLRQRRDVQVGDREYATDKKEYEKNISLLHPVSLPPSHVPQCLNLARNQLARRPGKQFAEEQEMNHFAKRSAVGVYLLYLKL